MRSSSPDLCWQLGQVVITMDGVAGEDSSAEQQGRDQASATGIGRGNSRSTAASLRSVVRE